MRGALVVVALAAALAGCDAASSPAPAPSSPSSPSSRASSPSSAAAPTTSAPSSADCRDWIARSVVDLERGPMEARAPRVVAALAAAPACVPSSIVAAARAGSLGGATLPAACASAASTIEIARACPLPPPLSIGDAALARMDASTYAVVLAIARGFADADALDERGRRFVDVVALSELLRRAR